MEESRCDSGKKESLGFGFVVSQVDAQRHSMTNCGGSPLVAEAQSNPIRRIPPSTNSQGHTGRSMHMQNPGALLGGRSTREREKFKIEALSHPGMGHQSDGTFVEALAGREGAD